MKPRIQYTDVQVGTLLPGQTIVVKRVDVLRYCGASGDFTATHYSERIAKSVGFPDVIMHGTMIIADAVRVVTDWVGDPGALIEYSVERLAHPVVVPDDDNGAALRISGHVEEKLSERRAVVRLTTVCDGLKVLAGVRAVVRLG